jgi:hypothetical protein
VLVLCLLVPLAALVAVISTVRSHTQTGTGVATVTPTINPRLVLRPHTVAFSGVLKDGSQLRGTLYPGFATQQNTLHVVIQRKGQLVARGHLDLSATMLGMHMLPVKGRLSAGHNGYSGLLYVPMFGNYRATIVLTAPGTHTTGVVTLSVPISLPGLGS